jgi:hypothetical protein
MVTKEAFGIGKRMWLGPFWRDGIQAEVVDLPVKDGHGLHLKEVVHYLETDDEYAGMSKSQNGPANSALWRISSHKRDSS